MRVFRLEHPTETARAWLPEGGTMTLPIGKGLFALMYDSEGIITGRDDHYVAFQRACLPPAVQSDIREPETYEVCGFRSLEQLHAWISIDDLEILSEVIDFVIREYEVDEDDVSFGEWQVIFWCNKARPVGIVANYAL